MDIAAGVVGFVGLTGQILQGCNYLCDFFSNAAEAPELILRLANELSAVQSSLSSLHTSLQKIEANIPRVHLQTSIPAIENCKPIVEDLNRFVLEHGELLSTSSTSHPTSVASTATSSSSRKRVRKAWQQIDVARKGSRLRDYTFRLEQAKTSLVLFQSEVALLLGQEALSSIGIIQGSLAQVTLNSATVSNNSLAVQRYAREANDASNLTRDAIAAMGAECINRFDSLPDKFASMLETTIVKTLARHEASRIATRAAPSHEAASHGPMSSEEDISYGAVMTQKKIAVSQSIRPLKDSNPPQHGQLGVFGRNLTWAPKRSRVDETTYKFWFGRISIATVVTEVVDHNVSASDSLHYPRSRRTTITLFPKTWLSKTGLKLQSGNSQPSFSHPIWDNRLRVFRTHQWESPVRKAIYDADLLEFRRLLGTGEVNPFDNMMGERYNKRTYSLFEVVMMCFHGNTSEDGNQSRRHLVEMARILAECDVDCGAGGVLWYVFHSRREGMDCEDVRSLGGILFRMVMAHSYSNPFEGEGIGSHYANRGLVERVAILGQDAWDISDMQEKIQTRWGPGAFQHFVLNYGDQESWVEQQTQIWRQRPVSSRKSREECLATFGHRFVGDHWPMLCWRDELPSFWRDREACLEAFGESFVKYSWPSLYWHLERPHFWQSRDACLEFFKHDFMKTTWSVLLGEECFDYLEGKWAWQCSGGDDRVPSSWEADMIKRWYKDDEAQRHSRQHCLRRYGVRFVQYQWASLLREDWVPEDQILDLTADGPDLIWQPSNNGAGSNGGTVSALDAKNVGVGQN